MFFNLFFGKRALFDLEATQITRDFLAEVFCKSVRAVSSDDLAVVYNLFIFKTRSVRVESSRINAAFYRSSRSHDEFVARRVVLPAVAYVFHVGMRICGRVIGVRRQFGYEFGNFLGFKNYFHVSDFFGFHGVFSVSDLFHLSVYFCGYRGGIELRSSVSLVEFDRLSALVPRRNSLYHYLVARLRLIYALAVFYRGFFLVYENFDRVYRAVLIIIGCVYRLRDFRGEFLGFVFLNIRRRVRFGFAAVGNFVRLVEHKFRPFSRRRDFAFQFAFGSRSVDRKGRFAFFAVVVFINRHGNVRIVGRPYGFEFSVDEKRLVRLVFHFVYPVIGKFLVLFKIFRYVNHASFTFTLSAGPPSVTLTHSLYPLPHIPAPTISSPPEIIVIDFRSSGTLPLITTGET